MNVFDDQINYSMLQQQQLAQKMATPVLGGWMVMEKWNLITRGSQRYTTVILPKS
jgi:hypothetical protein